MYLWLGILNFSLKLSLAKWRGVYYKLCRLGIWLQLGCLEIAIIWDTNALAKAVNQQVPVR